MFSLCLVNFILKKNCVYLLLDSQFYFDNMMKMIINQIICMIIICSHYWVWNYLLFRQYDEDDYKSDYLHDNNVFSLLGMDMTNIFLFGLFCLF